MTLRNARCNDEESDKTVTGTDCQQLEDGNRANSVIHENAVQY